MRGADGLPRPAHHIPFPPLGDQHHGYRDHPRPIRPTGHFPELREDVSIVANGVSWFSGGSIMAVDDAVTPAKVGMLFVLGIGAQRKGEGFNEAGNASHRWFATHRGVAGFGDTHRFDAVADSQGRPAAPAFRAVESLVFAFAAWSRTCAGRPTAGVRTR